MTTFYEYTTPAARRLVFKLIVRALALGYTISVNDGEAYTVKRSGNLAEILGALATTDNDTLIFRDSIGERVGHAWLIWENDADVISDYSANDAMDELVNGSAP